MPFGVAGGSGACPPEDVNDGCGLWAGREARRPGGAGRAAFGDLQGVGRYFVDRQRRGALGWAGRPAKVDRRWLLVGVHRKGRAVLAAVGADYALGVGPVELAGVRLPRVGRE